MTHEMRKTAALWVRSVTDPIKQYSIGRGYISTATYLAAFSVILSTANPAPSHARVFDCDWLAYRVEYNWAHRDTAWKAQMWEADKREFRTSNVCHKTYAEYYGLGKKKPAVKREKDPGNVQHAPSKRANTDPNRSYKPPSQKKYPPTGNDSSSKGIK